jgi:hypothetical protein
METGYIRIVQSAGREPSVEAELVGDTVWMCKYEIAKLFGCFPAKVEMNLRSIFKNRLLREDEVTMNHRYTLDGVERQRMYYNLEVLIFLSYRIGTFEAKIFRQFVNCALRRHLQRNESRAEEKLVWLFRKDQDYWLN